MSKLSIADAVKATGKAKSTLHDAIKSGKLPAARGPNQEWLIQVVDLETRYGTLRPVEEWDRPKPSKRTTSNASAATDDLERKNKTLEMKLEELSNAVEREKAERVREREAAQAHIDSLNASIAMQEKSQALQRQLVNRLLPAPESESDGRVVSDEERPASGTQRRWFTNPFRRAS